MLNDPERKGAFFENLTQHKEGDHSHVKYIKNKIKKLVD